MIALRPHRSPANGDACRLVVLRRYFVFVIPAHFAWEAAQLPLYTIWYTDALGKIAFAVVHCTGGDALITAASLLGALLLCGNQRWPNERYFTVAVPAVLAGVAYTIFSEWHNTEVRGSWAYSSLMPTLPAIGTGLSPLLQWLLIPIVAFWWARPRHAGQASRGGIMKTMLTRRSLLGLLAVAAVAGSGGLYVSGALSQGTTTIATLAKDTHFHGIAVDPSDSSRVYLATHHGLYVMGTDGRAQRISEVRDYMGFTTHPTDATVLFASGHPAGGGNLGFIVSRDGGRTWTKLSDGIGGPVDFHQMDVSKADPRVIYGVYQSLQRSTDGGQTWQVVGPAPADIIALAASSIEINTLYAATQGGLKQSTDGGRTWKTLTDRPTTMVHVTRDGTVYAFMIGTGLVRASERNLAWQALGKGFGDDYLLHLTTDPRDPKRLYAVTHNSRTRIQAVIVSRDGGERWTPLGAE